MRIIFFFFSWVNPIAVRWSREPFNGRRVLEVELAGLTQCARCDSINSVLSASVIISLHLCGRYLREYLSAGWVYMYAYVWLCACKEWLDAFPGVRDYVNMRGQAWNKMFSCPKPNGKLRARHCERSRVIVIYWEHQDSSFLLFTWENATTQYRDKTCNVLQRHESLITIINIINMCDHIAINNYAILTLTIIK